MRFSLLDATLHHITSRRQAALALALVSSSLLPPAALPAHANEVATGDVAKAQIESLADQGALGGLKPNTGRPLNALIKFRAETGVDRIGEGSPLFKPGQILDQLRTADGGSADIVFAFPEQWTLASGPNLDVRDVKLSDSAFVLAAPLPPRTKFEDVKDSWFVDVLLAPQGKYGSYGQCDDHKVTSSSLEPLTLPNGKEQAYRRLSLKFAPLTYNGNNVERKALISATSVGGTVFMLVSGSLATRYKTMKDELRDMQVSFRAIGSAKAT